MIVRSVNEIVVHLESFRNIDLIYQGVYALKVCVFESLPNGKRVYAHPYEFTESYTLPMDSNFSSPARIEAESSSFYSKGFPVKFSQEEVDINDVCSFRVQFEVCEQDNPRLQVEVSLMFYDHLASQRQSQLEKQQGTASETEDKSKNQLKAVQTRTLVLSKTRDPIHAFWPVLFNDHYFCQVGLVVHSACLDYRFRVSDIQLSEYVKLKPTEKQVLLTESKRIDKKNFSISMSVAKSLKVSEETLSNQMLVVEEVLVTQMKKAYDQLFRHYQIMSAKCSIDKNKKNGATMAQSLVLPSEDPSLLKVPTHQRLTKKYKSVYPDPLVTNILTESNFISSQLVLLWNQTLQIYKTQPKLCKSILQYGWTNAQREIWGSLVQRKFRIGHFFQAPVQPHEVHKQKVFGDLRNLKVKQQVWDPGFYPEYELTPVTFEDIYLRDRSQKEQETTQEYKGVHLFVLVHGFQGTSQDMRLIRNYILFMHPEAMLLSSSTNEDQTDTDIQVLGNRLASEVKSYINNHCPAGSLGRLSFIGYSMGGLKIRAALPLLKEYRQIMHSFITFSTPHLGLLYHSSSLVDAGIWILNKMKHSICLKQMSFTDAEKIEDSLIYKLAFFDGLGWFKHLLFMASPQDSYAPYESARMEMCKQAMADKKNGLAYQSMVKALTCNIQGGRLHRLDVSFQIKERNLNSLIGRSAHIMFVDSHALAKTVVFQFPHFFD